MPRVQKTLALLISRLAAERGHTYEAESSLRAALQKLQLQAILKADQQPIQQLAISPNQQTLATLDAIGTVRLWSLKTQTVAHRLQIGAAKPASAESKGLPPTAFKGAIAFTREGKLVTRSESAGIQIWSVELGKLLQTLDDGQREITQLAISPDGRWLAAAGGDSAPLPQGNRTIRIWQLSSGKLYLKLPQTAAIHSVAFSPDGQLLAVASGTTATVWQMQTGRQKYQLSHATTVTQAVFSPDGTMLATAADDGTRLWRVSGKLRQTLTSPLPDHPNYPAQPSSTLNVAFSPNGQTLASVKTNGQVHVWGLQAGQFREKVQGQVSLRSQSHTPVRPDLIRSQPQNVALIHLGIARIAFSPNNRQIAIATSTSDLHSTVSIRELSTGQEVSLFQNHSSKINAVEFSTDGSSIVTANADGSARFWTVDLHGELPALEIPSETMQWRLFSPIAFSPVG